jgi:hypothetical protein
MLTEYLSNYTKYVNEFTTESTTHTYIFPSEFSRTLSAAYFPTYSATAEYVGLLFLVGHGTEKTLLKRPFEPTNQHVS